VTARDPPDLIAATAQAFDDPTARIADSNLHAAFRI
jgi:hypothetical protein